MSETYDLHLQFPDIRDYVEWLDHNCAKCIHQQSGMGYQCQILEAVDRAVVSMKYEIPQATADLAGFRKEDIWSKSDVCGKFWSKRKKKGPQSDDAQ